MGKIVEQLRDYFKNTPQEEIDKEILTMMPWDDIGPTAKDYLTENETKCHPFIKWAGGKGQLIGEIEKSLPEDFRERSMTYVEPFVGGGAVLFHMLQEYPNIDSAIINDINRSLIISYRVVRDNIDELIDELNKISKEYLALSQEDRKAYFYSIRKNYNEEKNKSDKDKIKLAAMFIFLNKTCFNGLYRENKKGEFNVPFGGYANPKIMDEENLRQCSILLKRCTILNGDYEENTKYVFLDENILYYLDPPYRPIGKTSAFNTYSKEGFDDEEQIRLSDFCRDINECGGMFIESNSDSGTFFDELYEEFDIRRVKATRRINSKGDKRGEINELIITNIKKENRNETD